MKRAARYLTVALLFATTGLFAQAGVAATADQPGQGVVKLAKKSLKKHHRHHSRRGQ